MADFHFGGNFNPTSHCGDISGSVTHTFDGGPTVTGSIDHGVGCNHSNTFDGNATFGTPGGVTGHIGASSAGGGTITAGLNFPIN